jgi:hypothetical protein
MVRYQFMRQFIRPIAPVVFAGMAVLTLTGCGRSSSVSQNPTPVPVHGELIAVALTPAPVPKVVVAPVAVAQAASVATTVPTPPATPAPTPIVEVIPSIAPLVEAPKTLAPSPAPATDGYAVVGFDKLASYNFEVDDAPVTNQTAAADKANVQIPPRVKAFDDQKVSIKGFMLPLKVADGTVTEFLIMKDQSMCCYGSVPKITEWVSVKTPGKGIKPIMDQPISILGTLHVGALRENGYLVGIYQMDGDKLDTSSN